MKCPPTQTTTMTAKHERPASLYRQTLLSFETSKDIVVQNCYMSRPQQLANPRKRQRAKQHPLQLNEISQPGSKRQKKLGRHSTGSYPPSSFWDNLSKIWLTKDALRELDRRNTQSAPTPLHLPRRRANRPITPNCLAELRQVVAQGLPDISDLRGVCIVRYLTCSGRADDTL
jgi:hypothetical protein